MSSKVQIVWLRRDLRLDDHLPLEATLRVGLPVVLLFIFDQNILGTLQNPADGRVAFIHQQLSHINQCLQKYGSKLWVYYGKPLEVWQKILNQFNVHCVHVGRDYEPYARERDQSIYKFLKARGIAMYGYHDQVIFSPEDILKGDGTPYTVYTPYAKKWLQKFINASITSSTIDLSRVPFLETQFQPILSLEQMGFKSSTITFPDVHVPDSLLKNYGATRDYPALIGTSRWSLHLRFGTISIRTCAMRAYKLSEKFLNELIWREFYKMILWHFPHVTQSAFKPAYDRIIWRNNEKEFEAWCQGKTGYPIVDAGMRELNQTGHMHNRLRMITASFLTKHLLVDWRWGEAYFAEKLLDFELSSNNGGWQWAAGCGCDAAPYFRVFNPLLQTQRFDKNFAYIRKWVPEFENPKAYPPPIVAHNFARQRVLHAYKSAIEKTANTAM